MYVKIETADVPGELLDYAVTLTDDRHPDGQRIDWDDVIDRLDGFELDSGERADLGNSMVSPAIKRIKAHVRQVRRESSR